MVDGIDISDLQACPLTYCGSGHWRDRSTYIGKCLENGQLSGFPRNSVSEMALFETKGQRAVADSRLQVFQQLFAVGGFSTDGDRQVVCRLLLVKLFSLLLDVRSD
jgi:hypothetical protein